MKIKELKQIIDKYEKEFGNLRICVEYNGLDAEIESGDCFKIAYIECDGLTVDIILN